jgi:hypothetical protein
VLWGGVGGRVAVLVDMPLWTARYSSRCIGRGLEFEEVGLCEPDTAVWRGRGIGSAGTYSELDLFQLWLESELLASAAADMRPA